MGSQVLTERMKGGGERDELAGLHVEYRQTGIAHARNHPEEVKALLLPHLQAVCESISRSAIKGGRTAQRLFAEMLGLVGAKQDVIQAIVVQVGARSPEHLRSAATAALDAEAVDDETAYAQALEFVNEYRKERGLPALIEVPPEESGEVPGA